MSAARFASALAAVTTLTLSAVASAQEAPAPAAEAAPAPVGAPAPVAAPVAIAPTVQVSAPAERQHSINVNPLGVLSGVYSLNYQYLFGGGHAILVEGDYASSSGDAASSSSFGGLLGYRWFINGTQNSWFLGFSVDYSVGTGTATITTTDAQGMENEETFELDVASLGVTGNFGKRWQLGGGVNITARLGAGYGKHTVDANTDDPDAQEAEDTVNDILSFFPFAVDGELSLGYSF